MSNQTLEAIVDKVFSCTTVVQTHTTKETNKPTQYIITLKSPKEMGAKLGLEPASITITIKAEADLAKNLFPQDHAFRVTFQKTSLHYNNPTQDNNNSQKGHQSTLQLIDPNPSNNPDPNQTEAETDQPFWNYQTDPDEYPIDDETCEAPQP
jgi:hypothetical protein